MARSLVNKPNTIPPDSDYPFGRTKDNNGSNNGTPVNELTHGDFHQFFAKLLSDAGIAPNELPENAYSGFQFNQALSALIASYKSTSVSSNLIAIGSKTFAVGTGYSYGIGNRIRATDAANSANYVEGSVTSYSGGNLVILVDTIGGSGTKTSWLINLGGDGSGINSAWFAANMTNYNDLTNSNTAIYYRIVGKEVFIRGFIVVDTLSASSYEIVSSGNALPVGYRPDSVNCEKAIAILGTGVVLTACITITTSGTVTVRFNDGPAGLYDNKQSSFQISYITE